jgi:hypothetical protein
MAGDKWILIRDATDFIGKKRGACRLINREYKLGTIQLQGIRPGEREPVEIPSNEGGRLDCVGSRLVLGRLLTLYESVIIKWDDVKRLTQTDVDEQTRVARNEAAAAAPPPKQAPQNASVTESARDVSPVETGRAGGKKSAEKRREKREKWVPHARELAKEAYLRNPAASNDDIASEIESSWKLGDVDCPGHGTLWVFVSDLRKSGDLPQRRPSSRK